MSKDIGTLARAIFPSPALVEFAKRRLSVLLAGIAALLLAGTLAGCSGRYGSTKYDARVGEDFAIARVLEGHRYYATGSEFWPAALLALREDRPLRSDLWHEVPMSPETLARLVSNMRGTRNDTPGSYVLLDDRGERIGVWYSLLPPTPVNILDDGGVLISPPFGTVEDGPRTNLNGKD